MGLEIRNVSQLQHKLRALPEEVHDAVVEAVQEEGVRIRDQARENAPMDEGDLRRSIRKRRLERGLDARVGTRLYYAKFIEFGTKSHLIRPKDPGSVLAGGEFGPVKFARHPGTPARPFLQPAAEASRKEFPGRLARKVNEATSKVAR